MIVALVDDPVKIIVGSTAVRLGAVIVSEVHERVIAKLKVDDTGATVVKLVIEQVNVTDWVLYGPGRDANVNCWFVYDQITFDEDEVQVLDPHPPLRVSVNADIGVTEA